MIRHVITVDPGVFTMGVCLWDEREFYSDHLALPCKRICKDLKPTDRKRMGARGAIDHLILWLRAWFEEFEITECWCEKPSVWSTAKGYAANFQGNILNMELFRGRLYQTCMEFQTVFHDVPVTEWKGNLSKKLVVERLKTLMFEHNGKIKSTILSRQCSHDWDAAGIGFYVQGFFK